MPSVAYIPVYTKSHSVGGDPETDYAIGVAHGVVGCGVAFTEKTLRGLTWFTLINGRIIYNGPLLSRYPSNPWAESNNKWKAYKVDHHVDLGPIDSVLTEAGVTREVLPHSQNRFVKDGPMIRALIAYAESRVPTSEPTTDTAPVHATEPAVRTKYTDKIANYTTLLESMTEPEAVKMVRRKIRKYERLSAPTV